MMAVSPWASERVSVPMPADVVSGIDRYDRNRSRLVAEAVRHELKRRRRLELLRSLDSPHPESLATAALRLQTLGDSLPDHDGDLLDPAAGLPLSWNTP